MSLAEFRMSTNTVEPHVGRQVVEIVMNGKVVGALYPHEHGVQLITGHLHDVASVEIGEIVKMLMVFRHRGGG